MIRTVTLDGVTVTISTPGSTRARWRRPQYSLIRGVIVWRRRL